MANAKQHEEVIENGAYFITTVFIAAGFGSL
jgi:hypothetical protein